MKTTAAFPAIVKNGKIELVNRDHFLTFVRTQPDGNYHLFLKKHSRVRSTPQNSYYWGVVLPLISDATGHTCDELHEIFKQKFLPRQIIEFNGAEYVMRGSTTKLSTAEFSEYVERIRAEAANMGINIPDPL